MLLVFICCQLSLFAQQGWELGGWIGASHYFGDLNTSYNINHPGLAAGIIGRFNFNNRVCLKFSGNYGNVSANDADSKNTYEHERNLSFRSRIWDASSQFEFNFLPYNHGSKDEFFTPYIFAGLSVFKFNPLADTDNGRVVELATLGTEGQFKGDEYSTVAGAWLYGGGFKIDLSYEWSINIELAMRQTFTDYLDDVSTVYPNMRDLESLRGQLAVQMSDRSENLIGEKGRQRGNSRTKDTYGMLGIGIVYYFGDLQCPKW
ncbi:MAG: outer membrane beta-barrel protein [Saprospiraceae bacterium]|nr:outer membrane beta-barrel protein [Saprospiraceae bacterium]MBP7699081.1 outer membrane beta-barrel protein [Saprospiraceae bacterium]